MSPTVAKPPTKQLSIRVALDVAEWLQQEAAADQRSLAFIVTALARAEMERRGKTTKPAKPLKVEKKKSV